MQFFGCARLQGNNHCTRGKDSLAAVDNSDRELGDQPRRLARLVGRGVFDRDVELAIVGIFFECVYMVLDNLSPGHVSAICLHGLFDEYVHACIFDVHVFIYACVHVCITFMYGRHVCMYGRWYVRTYVCMHFVCGYVVACDLANDANFVTRT